jgi:hypothetical protein
MNVELEKHLKQLNAAQALKAKILESLKDASTEERELATLILEDGIERIEREIVESLQEYQKAKLPSFLSALAIEG